MKRQTICFLMPFYGADTPIGGLKMVLMYANRLAADGYNVKVVYPYTTNHKKRLTYWQRLRDIKTYYANRKTWMSSDNWFEKHKKVEEVETYSLSHYFVPQADIYIATGVETADWVKEYPKEKYYFVQGYENWGRTDEELIDTYHYPLHKIAVSTWLQKKVQEVGEKCDVVFNGYELNKFFVQKDIKKRTSTNICMLYHDQDLKNSLLGFRALEIVHHKLPSIKVNIFGVAQRPANLPEWYNYTQRPTPQELLQVYNDSAIFIGTSDAEGWGLTVGEAMLCGNAVACTDIDGYKEMAIDGENALLSPVGDAERMAENILRLINDDELRIRLATRAADEIKKFSISKSYEGFKKALGLS